MGATPSPSCSESLERPDVRVGTPALTCATACTAAALHDHFRIRRAVFVTEQALFSGHDRDRADERPEVVHVVGYVDGVAAGTVRLYPVAAEIPGESLWKGDRLAVLPEQRRAGLGAPLVQYAVRTAGELGGDRMIAHIQLGNVAFFRRLGWTLVGEPTQYVGVPHQKMSIGLG